MPLPTAHVAGLPLEETLLAAGPALLIWGGLVGLQIRQRLHRLRPRRVGATPTVTTATPGPVAAAAARRAPIAPARRPPTPSNHRSPDRGLLR